jgi:predicted metal-dependent phosphoesterase TrpH
LIDLHTHTTASDGRCSPAELVARARAAGVDVLSVTDHDTTASAGAASAACASAGVEFVPGIEITAVIDGKDVHVLGYFIDPNAASLEAFLVEQRRRRVDRLRQIIDRLAGHGIVLDADAVLQPGRDDASKAAGRPWVARALVAEGHVADTKEAFDRFLAAGKLAFVPRIGPVPADVFRRIHRAGGIASLAHPGLLGRDYLIPRFVRHGLDALEAYHGKHAPDDTTRYLAIADRYGLAISGGSDYHADPSHDTGGPGSVSLAPEAFQLLKDRCAARRATASGEATSS